MLELCAIDRYRQTDYETKTVLFVNEYFFCVSRIKSHDVRLNQEHPFNELIPIL